MTVRLGIIVESPSDREVIKLLLQSLGARPFSTMSFVAHGCGKLIGKCAPWAVNLRARGCAALLVVHDSDDNDSGELRRALAARIAEPQFRVKSIVIPVREIEAWLLADPSAIHAAFELKTKIPALNKPETEADPKRRLSEFIYAASDKRVDYVNSVHNVRIARYIDVKRVEKKCPSFSPLKEFAGLL